MFQKAISLLLALLLVCTVTACTGAHTPAQSDATTLTQSTAQENSTAAGEQSTTGKPKKQSKSTTKKKKKKSNADKKSTTAANGKTSQKTDSQSDSTKKDSGKKQSGSKQTTKKQTTTKKQATTKKQPTTKKQKQSLFVTFTITCSAAVGKVDGVPSSGYFLKGAGVSVSNGANVYEALVKCCDANGVALVASNTMYGMYVSSIGGLAEFEAGKMSGWTYTVNGKYPPKACDKYVLSDGDHVEFIYKAG